MQINHWCGFRRNGGVFLHLSVMEKLFRILAEVGSQVKRTRGYKRLVFDVLSYVFISSTRCAFIKRDSSEWKLLFFTWLLSMLSWGLILQQYKEAHTHTQIDNYKHICASIYRRYKSEVRHCASLQNLIIGIFRIGLLFQREQRLQQSN